MRRLVAGSVLAAMVLSAGCSDESERPDCIQFPSTTCNPVHDPVTFEILFNTILSPKCGSTKACHGTARGGLAFTDIDQSFDLLRGNTGGKARVKPFDAECSELVVRTHVTGEEWSMPPGTPLTEPERCEIRKWVEAGATRQ